MPQPRGVIRHSVSDTRDVVFEREEPVESLVQGMLAEDSGGRGRRGDRAAAIPEESGKVVCVRAHSAFADVKALCSHIVMQVGTDQFKLGIVEGAVRVVKSPQGLRNVSGEFAAPQDRGSLGAGRGTACGGAKGGGARDGGGVREPDTAGAEARRVVCADDAWSRGDKFIKARGARAQSVVNPAEVIQCLVEAGSEPQPRALTVVQDLLKVAEKPPGAGKG